VIEDNLGQGHDCGGAFDPALGVKRVIADNAAFRSLMSELGVAFAPSLLSPAATRGFAGFTFSVEFGFTSINARRLANAGTAPSATAPAEHWYWRAAESVSPTAFADGTIRTPGDVALIEQELPKSIAPTIAVMVRKGLWLPTPSFELGFGVRHLLGSRMAAGTVEAKLALHEGFQGLPIPALAARGTVSHVFGTSGFNLTVGGLDFSVSKHFGVGSTFNLTPFAGYQMLWIVATSGVLDATPGIDGFALGAKGKDPLQNTQCTHGDCNASFTFDPQGEIRRHRLFFGLRANFYLVSFLVQYSYFLKGDSIEEVNKTPDESGAQHAVQLSLAFDY
jgi:hypothetical protein